jgi:uncharacterized surface protein with fasciclin (FAS1) repeats
MRTIVSFKTLKSWMLLGFTALVFAACQKTAEQNVSEPNATQQQRVQLEQEAAQMKQTETGSIAAEGAAVGLVAEDENATDQRTTRPTITQIVVGNSNFSALVAAASVTGLVPALSNPEATLTVFAPTNHAFAQLPAPFNTPANISAITNPAQIAFLKNVLLYHVLGAKVRARDIASGRSSATTLKTRGTANDNTIYLSKAFGIIRINGNNTVIFPNVRASNGIIHVIDKVLLFPTNNVAELAIATPALSTLVAALVKTNLAGVFTAAGDYSVFAPTNDAFSKLAPPFNNAANISSITNPEQITALANILKYHVTSTRYFGWDLGIFEDVETIAPAPNNKLVTIIGRPVGFVLGNNNNRFAKITPGNILATNGVVHVIDKVLLP